MRDNREWLRTGAQLMVLSLINEKDRYGYEIIQELVRRSDEVFQMKEGTLYPILHRLENEGHLKSYKQKTVENRERKYYRITKKGKTQLQEEKEKWSVFSNSVKKVVNGMELTLNGR